MLYPVYFKVVRREPGAWYSPRCSLITLGDRSCGIDPANIEAHYGLTREKIVTELFRRWLGRTGYYLVNMRERRYYYCGLTEADVQAKFHELGFGVADMA